MGFDRERIRRAFGRASSHYEQHAWLQREVRSRLHERLEHFEPDPSLIVDIGCGGGHGSAELKRRYPKATVAALDLAWPMCRAARRQSRWLRPLQIMQADAARLPLAAASADLLISNLTLQWLNDLPAVFQGFRRVLKPGGLLLFSTFGPDTLTELRQAWAAAGEPARVSEFIDQHIIGDWLLAGGFRDPVTDCDWITSTYSDAGVLLDELKAIGSGNARADRPRRLTSRRQLQAMRREYEAFRDPATGRLPATWEVIYAAAIGPEPGQPIRTAQGEQASFPADRIPIRRRS